MDGGRVGKGKRMYYRITILMFLIVKVLHLLLQRGRDRGSRKGENF